MKKILVRAPQWLGDAVVSTIFLSRLHHREPEAAIYVLCAEGVAPVFRTCPGVSGVLTYRPRHDSVLEIGRRLKQECFDAVYLLPRSFRTALEAWLSGAPERIGFRADFRSALLTRRADYDYGAPFPFRYLRLLGERSLPQEDIHPYFPSIAPPTEREAAILGAPLASLARPLLGVAPASIAPARTWSAAGFAAVAERLQRRHGGTVVLFGTERERAVCDAVATRLGGPFVNTAGRLSLIELGWLMSALNLFLGNDSGLMHIAAAFRIPSAIVFGSSDPALILPFWAPFVSVKADGIWCSPCVRNECVRFGAQKYACFQAVSPEQVEATAETLLGARASDGTRR